MATTSKNNIPVNQRTIDFFKGKFVGGGARPNLFECIINIPEGPKSGEEGVDDKMRFMIKAAQLPASNVNTIPIPFRGREFKIAGDRSFEPWTVTVLNDTDFSIRRAFERWMNILNKHEDNAGVINPGEYMRNMRVLQLGRAATREERQYQQQQQFPGFAAVYLLQCAENSVPGFRCKPKQVHFSI